MALAEEASQLKLDGLIGFSGSVTNGLHVVRSANLPGTGEWIVYPLGSLVVVRQSGTSSAVAFLQSHSDDVSCVCVSHDGTRLASGQDSHQGVAADVIVWDLQEACEAALAGETVSDKVVVHRLRQHKGSVQAVSVNATDTLLATLGGRDDNALVVWDLKSGAAICGQPAAADNTLALRWLNKNPDRLITCGSRHLRVWQVDASLPKLHAVDASLGTLKRVMRCVGVTADDEFAYVGTTTGEVLKFTIDRDGIQLPNDPDRLRPMLKHVSSKRVGMGVCACECWTNPKSGNDNVLVGGGDGSLLMFNGELNTVQNKKEDLQGAVTSISLVARDEPVFYVGTSEANRYRVDIKEWRADLLSTAHVAKVKDVVFPPECSDLFVTCSGGGDVRVWNAKKRVELLRIRVPNLECEAVVCSDDGSEIVSGWSDGRVRSFFPESGKLKFVINDAHTDGVTALAVVPRKTRDNAAWTLCSGGRDGRVRAWRVTSSHQPMLFSIKEHRGTVTALKVSGDGSHVVSASADGSCLSFCLKTQVRKLALFEPNVFTQVAWHPDESQLLTTGSNYKITYWDSYDGSKIRVLDGSFTDEMTALDVEKKNGSWFLAGSADKTIKFWNYDDGIATACGVGHSKRVNAVKISPNQHFAISVGDEGGIYIWNLRGLQYNDDAA
ncbi:hypothetical protein CTAYLR_009751 [Chrysophaeum taylorii]|uniref:Cilia- and flagella-associated protein 52 n=1 Tax=Chrysophaeum taylorii TaxID=2483200 RepID=A0AAD7UL75_9STRA|nr:hypothetical protein CTAYLR_009751 [Chrysophaeum taylorii]